MKLQHNKLWLAIGLGVLSGPALAASIDCTLTPANSVIWAGETLQLAATCEGGPLEKIVWYEGKTSLAAGSIVATVNLWGDTSKPIYFTTPVSTAGNYVFTVEGTPKAGTGNTWGSSSEARVSVIGTTTTNVALTDQVAATATASNAADGACGTVSGTTVTTFPSNGTLCLTGKSSLVITGPNYMTWSCLGQAGGVEANCYVSKGVVYTVNVTNANPAGGSYTINPSSGQVGSGGSVTVNATPTGTNVATISGCGGIQSGSTFNIASVTQNCTVNLTFSSAPAAINGSCGTANGQTFSSAPTANLCSAGTASAVATGSSYTWSCAGSNGGSTASCSATIPAPVSSSEDPGFGKGLWVPSNTTDRVIADQSGPGVQNLTDYLPGCLNGLLPPTASASGCGGMASYTGTLYGTSTSYTFQYGSGKTLGLRFMSKANAGTSMKYFLMYSGDGGSTGGPVSIWLSQDPTATYATTPAACKSQSTTQPYVITGPGYCPIEPNKMYYLFTKVDINCTTCRYRIEENASDFY